MYSDPEYVLQRNSLIHEAVRFADSKHGFSGKLQDNETWAAKWNYTYHQKMNELWAAFNKKQKVLDAYVQSIQKRADAKHFDSQAFNGKEEKEVKKDAV